MSVSRLGEQSTPISWTEIQGNKYMKALHPAMLSKGGYVATHKARLIGHPKTASYYSTISYDRNYVINWLQTKFVRPLENEPLDELTKLLAEAYQKAKGKHKNLLIPWSNDEQI